MPNRKLSVKKKTIFYFLIYILMWFSMYFLGVLFGKYSIYENTLGLLSIVACSWIAYRFRKNTSLFICFFFIAYSVYSIVFGVYLYPEIRPDWLYSQFSDNSVFVIGMQCIFLFSITMVYLVENGLLNDKIG